MKKRIAQALRRISQRLVNEDFSHPDARRQMYRRYYSAIKKEFKQMSPDRQTLFLKENRE